MISLEKKSKSEIEMEYREWPWNQQANGHSRKAKDPQCLRGYCIDLAGIAPFVYKRQKRGRC